MNVPFKKGIKRITGKKRHREALYAFRKLLEEEFLDPHFPRKYRDPGIRTKAIDELIAAYERDGFAPEEVERRTLQYQSLPRRKPRRKIKKEFDAKGLPKMRKTPEDLAIMREFIEIRNRSLGQK